MKPESTICMFLLNPALLYNSTVLRYLTCYILINVELYTVTHASLSDLSQTTSGHVYYLDCYCYSRAINMLLVYCFH